MSIHTDPNAAHAQYSPSSAHRWTVCTASAQGIAALGEQEEGEAAAKGTAAHTEMERCLGKLNGEFVDPATMPVLSVDPDHPSAMGVARAIAFFRQLPPGRVWIEQRVALTDQIWGRADLQHWHEETATFTTLDLKDGFVGVDPDAEQIWIYDVAGMLTYKLPAKWFRNVICQEHDFRPVPRVKQAVEVAADVYAWAEKIAAIPRGPLTFVAGEQQCTYCPLFGRCEATQDLLPQLAALVVGLMTADQVRPEQRALFLACKKPIADAFKNAEKVWQKDAIAGKDAPGLRVVTSQGHKAWSDPAAARALVMERLGPEGLDVPTPAQAIERGIPEDVVNPMAPRPPGGPVLAFASDKRPEWKQKSAADMFAGVAGMVK